MKKGAMGQVDRLLVLLVDTFCFCILSNITLMMTTAWDKYFLGKIDCNIFTFCTVTNFKEGMLSYNKKKRLEIKFYFMF